MGDGGPGPGSASTRFDAIGQVLRSRNLRRLHAGRLLWQSAELAQMVALLVFAYDRGGAGEVALFGVVRTAAVAASVPFVAVLGDRLPRVAVLTGGALVGAISLAAAAAAAATHAPSLVVYGMSALAAIAVAVQRPTACALVPSLVQRPAELVAHNLVGTVVEGATALAGPVLGAVLVDRLGVAGCLAVTSALVVSVATTFATLRRSVPAAVPLHANASTASASGSLSAGFREIGGNPTSRLLTLLGSSQTMVRGALNVLVVVLAVDLLAMQESGVGVLLGAVGVGSLLGGVATVRFVGSDRLGRTLALGLILWGTPIAVVAFAPNPAVAVVVLAVIGLGNNLVDVSLFTLLQRSVPNEILARVMGALETSLQAGMALGALVAAAFLAVLGDRGALIAVGALLPAVALLSMPALVALDRRSEIRDGDVTLLQGMPLFRPLPLVGLEQLAARLSEPRWFAPGTDVILVGEEGDRYFVIEDGEAEVVVGGLPVSSLRAGEGFGEIALLRDVPRIATVRASAPLRLRALERADFLAVVTGDPRCAAVADEMVDERLPPRPRPADAVNGPPPRTGRQRPLHADRHPSGSDLQDR